MKIMFYGQNPRYNSGMGRVGREVATHLGKYHDVHYYGQTCEGGPVREMNGFKLYGNPFNDPTGSQMLGQRVSQIQPDVFISNLNYHQLGGVADVLNNVKMNANHPVDVYLYTAIETQRPIPGLKEQILSNHLNDVTLIPFNPPQEELHEDGMGDFFDREDNAHLADPIPHGLDHSTFQQSPQLAAMGTQMLREQGVPEDAFTFLFVGENWRRKRIDKLCHAFSKLKDEVDEDVRLILHTSAGPSRGDDFFAGWNIASGPGVPNPVLDQYDLQLGEDVHLTKQHSAQFLPDQQMAALYNACDAHVLPTMGEGFGMTLLESMACGTPPVVTDLDTTRWLCEDAALYVDGEGEELMRMGEVLVTPDPDSMAEQMQEMYENDGLRSELADKGVKRAQDFSWRETGNMFDELISGDV